MFSPSIERAQERQFHEAESRHLRLACDPKAPQVVRAAINQMPDIDRVRNDALLVASELVTNAVLHSGADSEQTIDVQLIRTADTLIISVLDPGVDGGVAEVELEDRPTHGGWGLRVVAELARRWGRERRDGYRVWAELGV